MSEDKKIFHLFKMIELGRRFDFVEHPDFQQELHENDIEDFMDYFSECLPEYKSEYETVFVTNFIGKLDFYFPDEDHKQVVIDCLILRICYNFETTPSFYQIKNLTQGNNQYSATVFDAIKNSNIERLEFFNRNRATKEALTYLKSTGFSADDAFFKRSEQKLGDILVMPMIDISHEMLQSGDIQFTTTENRKKRYEDLIQHAISLYPASELQISERAKPQLDTFLIKDIFRKHIPE